MDSEKPSIESSAWGRGLSTARNFAWAKFVFAQDDMKLTIT